MHSSIAYRQFNSNFMCCDPMILPYELVPSRNPGTVGHNVRLPWEEWQVLDVYASRLITLTPPEYGAPLSSCDKFVKDAPLLREEIGKLLFVLIWRNLSCNELRKQLSRNGDIDAKPLTTLVHLGIPPRHLSASTLTHSDLIQRRYS
ncbi:hypothetical protein AVEN_152140-1 [Araneus ventricosus]|uniref:Uncharacterized protein n=1 Tax=Araneus ventricosus TaxID=182803 RepID=A0A4Y2MX51_ARAVE|nr:hypothetical protein AVEN_152140-1 [Araneus ventricosus]